MVASWVGPDGWLYVTSEVYTSKRALLAWLDTEACEAANKVALGTKVRVRSSDLHHECVVIRMKRGGQVGKGKWRVAQPHELGLAPRPYRKRRDRHTERLADDAKQAFGGLLGRSDD